MNDGEKVAYEMGVARGVMIGVVVTIIVVVITLLMAPRALAQEESAILVTGPQGQAFEACGATYKLPPIKAIQFHCCGDDCVVYSNGFEEN